MTKWNILQKAHFVVKHQDKVKRTMYTVQGAGKWKTSWKSMQVGKRNWCNDLLRVSFLEASPYLVVRSRYFPISATISVKNTKNAPHCNIPVTCFMLRIFQPFNLVRNPRSSAPSVQERNLLLSTHGQAIRPKRRPHWTQRPNRHSLLPVKNLVIINTYKNKFSYLWSTYL